MNPSKMWIPLISHLFLIFRWKNNYYFAQKGLFNEVWVIKLTCQRNLFLLLFNPWLLVHCSTRFHWPQLVHTQEVLWPFFPFFSSLFFLLPTCLLLSRDNLSLKSNPNFISIIIGSKHFRQQCSTIALNCVWLSYSVSSYTCLLYTSRCV